jgi:hypothetical protein
MERSQLGSGRIGGEGCQGVRVSGQGGRESFQRRNAATSLATRRPARPSQS